MNILVPKAITASMFGAGTDIPAVDSSVGEVAWVSGTNYAVKDRRVDGDYVYECVQAITSAPQNTYPPSDARSAGYWLIDKRNPTNRMAPFDKYLFTKAKRVGSVTYQLTPGFVNGLALYGVDGDHIAITVTDGNGLDLMPPVAEDLWDMPFDEYEYLFGEMGRRSYFTVSGLPLHPDVVITITVSRNVPAETASIGFLSVGTWERLLAPISSPTTGVQYGVEATTRDYSTYIDYPDGMYEEVEGRKATDINLSCVIDAGEAPAALGLLEQILGKAVAIEVSDLPRYSHLATVGKVTGSVRAVTWPTAQVDLQIKGNV